MIPHPPQLDAAYGTVAWQPLVRVTLQDENGSTEVYPTDGVIRHDAEAWPRTELTMALPTAITPGQTTPPVSAYGGTVTVVAGAKVEGVEYLFTVATLDVAEVGIRRPDGTITVRAVSHEARVNENRYGTVTNTVAALSSALVTTEVRRTLGPTHPVVNLLTTDRSVPVSEFQWDGDVWPTIVAIMDATGGEAFFDQSGALVLRDNPVKGTPTTTVQVGTDGTVCAYDSQRRWAFNRVDVRCMLAGAMVRLGTWEDTNPASLTRVSGPYGKHTDVREVNVGATPTLAVANAYAAAVARRAAAPFRRVTVDTVPAPWVIPGDTVRADLLGDLSETLLVSSHTWPLSQLDPGTLVFVDDTYTSGA